MKTGVILGRFMPPHEGHVALIRTAAHLVDRLTIIVSVTDHDPISPALRKQWMEQLFPGCPVIVHNSGAHHLASEDGSWAAIIRGFHPERIDRVIGSEAYIKPLAEALGAQHFILDPMWMALPANSSDIRRDPFGHWQSIPGLVRPHFQKRLTMVGGESTGKSFMAKFLAEKFGGPYVPEFGRPYEKFRTPGPYRPEELHLIVDGHEAHRKTLATNAGPVLFEDTDALLTAVWAEMLLGHSLPDLEARIVLPDHYLLLDHNVGWENDPIRYFGQPELRRTFYEKTLAKLEKFGASWTLVSGDYAEREASAIAVTERMLAEPKRQNGVRE